MACLVYGRLARVRILQSPPLFVLREKRFHASLPNESKSVLSKTVACLAALASATGAARWSSSSCEEPGKHFQDTEKEDLRLYYSPGSSASLRVLLALRCKRIPKTYVQLVPLRGCSGEGGKSFWQLPPDDPASHRLGTSDYFAFNREGRVPVLMIGMQQLTQSGAIISYLDNAARFSESYRLFPADALRNARVLQIVNIVQCDIHPLQNLGLLTMAIRDFGMSGCISRSHPFSLHFMRRGLAGVEVILEETAGKFSVGDELSAADIYLIGQLRNAFNAGIDVAVEFPMSYRVWAHCLDIPEIRATLEEFGGLPNTKPKGPQSEG